MLRDALGSLVGQNCLGFLFLAVHLKDSLGIAKDYLALSMVYEKMQDIDLSYEVAKRGLYIYDSLEKLFPEMNLASEKQAILKKLIDIAGKLSSQSDVIYYRSLLNALDME